MSRAYRVSVCESARHLVRAEDHVGTTLELLEILPREAMADLLRAELAGRGFRPEGDALVRRGEGVRVAVDPATGAVEVRAETTEQVELEARRGGYADTDSGGAGRQRAEAALREAARQDLEQQAQSHGARLQEQITGRLEGELAGLRAELDQILNRVTAEALKRKAAQLGQIKEMTEDQQSGSLTIVLEV